MRQLSSLKSIHLVASFVIGLSSFYHKKSVIFCSKCVYYELSACLSKFVVKSHVYPQFPTKSHVT